jgi:hypothetical protein
VVWRDNGFNCPQIFATYLSCLKNALNHFTLLQPIQNVFYDVSNNIHFSTFIWMFLLLTPKP